MKITTITNNNIKTVFNIEIKARNDCDEKSKHLIEFTSIFKTGQFISFYLEKDGRKEIEIIRYDLVDLPYYTEICLYDDKYNIFYYTGFNGNISIYNNGYKIYYGEYKEYESKYDVINSGIT